MKRLFGGYPRIETPQMHEPAHSRSSNIFRRFLPTHCRWTKSCLECFKTLRMPGQTKIAFQVVLVTATPQKKEKMHPSRPAGSARWFASWCAGHSGPGAQPDTRASGVHPAGPGRWREPAIGAGRSEPHLGQEIILRKPTNWCRTASMRRISHDTTHPEGPLAKD